MPSSAGGIDPRRRLTGRSMMDRVVTATVKFG